jgi:hypothetical protein
VIHFVAMKQFLLILIAASAISMINGQESKPHSNTDKGNPAAANKDAASASGKALPVVNEQAHQGRKDGEAAQPPSYLHELLLPANALTLALVIVGIGGIVIAVRTLIAIERQTKAAEDAAETALLSAKALADAERPWLAVDVAPIEGLPYAFQFSVKNLGRTPAKLIGTSTVQVVCETLPDEPEYPDGLSAVEGKREESGEAWMLAPNEIWKFKVVDMSGIEPGWMMNQLAFNDVKTGKRKFFYFGKVQYRDVFGPDVHETGFCYIYRLADFRRFSAPAYNRYT